LQKLARAVGARLVKWNEIQLFADLLDCLLSAFFVLLATLCVLREALPLHLDFKLKVYFAGEEVHASELIKLETNLLILLNRKVDEDLEMSTTELEGLLVERVVIVQFDKYVVMEANIRVYVHFVASELAAGENRRSQMKVDTQMTEKEPDAPVLDTQQLVKEFQNLLLQNKIMILGSLVQHVLDDSALGATNTQDE
jgi:hypothetical protein